MIAPRASPWAAALCAPLMFSQARGRHAQHPVRLHEGVRLVFDRMFLGLMLRMLGRMFHALCTLRFLDLAVLMAYSFAGLCAIATGIALIGDEVPRAGLLAPRVRMRLYHPLLEWLVPARYADV